MARMRARELCSKWRGWESIRRRSLLDCLRVVVSKVACIYRGDRGSVGEMRKVIVIPKRFDLVPALHRKSEMSTMTLHLYFEKVLTSGISSVYSIRILLILIQYR